MRMTEEQHKELMSECKQKVQEMIENNVSDNEIEQYLIEFNKKHGIKNFTMVQRWLLDGLMYRRG